MFVWVAALPLLSKQGESEIKNTCLRRVKNLRKGGQTYFGDFFKTPQCVDLAIAARLLMWPLSVARLAGERSEPGCRNGVYWGTSVPFIRVKWANHFFIFILEGIRRFLSMFSSFWPAIVLSRLVKSYSLNFYFIFYFFFHLSIFFSSQLSLQKKLLTWLIIKLSPKLILIWKYNWEICWDCS